MFKAGRQRYCRKPGRAPVTISELLAIFAILVVVLLTAYGYTSVFDPRHR